MKLKLSLVQGDGAVDITLTADAETRVGEVADALVRMNPDRPPATPSADLTLCIHDGDPQVLDPEVNLASSGARSGARIEILAASRDRT